MKTTVALATILFSATSLPSVAYAQSVPAAATISLPVQLGPNARERYRDIFASIDSGKWSDAATKLAAMDEGPLHPVARAIIYTAKGSPKVEPTDLVNLASTAPDLPMAPSLVRLAAARGAVSVPLLPEVREMTWLGSSPRRGRTATTEGDPAAGGLAAQILPLIKDDRPRRCRSAAHAQSGSTDPRSPHRVATARCLVLFPDG